MRVQRLGVRRRETKGLHATLGSITLSACLSLGTKYSSRLVAGDLESIYTVITRFGVIWIELTSIKFKFMNHECVRSPCL